MRRKFGDGKAEKPVVKGSMQWTPSPRFIPNDPDEMKPEEKQQSEKGGG